MNQLTNYSPSHHGLVDGRRLHSSLSPSLSHSWARSSRSAMGTGRREGPGYRKWQGVTVTGATRPRRRNRDSTADDLSGSKTKTAIRIHQDDPIRKWTLSYQLISSNDGWIFVTIVIEILSDVTNRAINIESLKFQKSIFISLTFLTYL